MGRRESDLRSGLGRAGRFVREYTAGVRGGDLRRLFREDAADAYQVLTRDQPQVPESAEGARAFFQRVRLLFLGLSYQLSPPRRLLFALAILLALIGSCRIEYTTGAGVHIGTSTGALIVSVAVLVFLLALELVDRVRVRDELEVARELQRQLLPREAPDLPGWRIAHSYRTANEVGGDYYDFRRLPDGRVAVVAGDASGHGIAAGLLMVIAHSTLKLAFDQDPRPRAVLPMVNKAIAAAGGRRAFLTLFYGLLDPETGRLDYICAGHPFPLLRRAGGRVREIGSGALPLGIRESIELATESVTLEPDDLLLIYSDGIPEVLRRSTGETFGFQRMRDLAAAGGTAQETHDRVLSAFDGFLAGEPQTDDISLVVLHRLPAVPPPPPPPPAPGGPS
ncbi:MAG: PP2C family protein-serine/threonine phosphatase [Acidobacteriota bacterium]|jgi:hypothetical protein